MDSCTQPSSTADRRRNIRTDDSTASTQIITDWLRNLIMNSWKAGQYPMSNSEIEKAKSEYILNRMLSTKSEISIDSSLAEMNQRAQDDAALRTFASIGSGQTGTVYALKGTTMVIKLPNSSEQSDILFADFQNHQRVFEAFRGTSAALRTDINVPEPEMWVSPSSDHFWSINAALFPEEVQVPDYGLVSERIYPLPEPVRSALVDAFAPRAIQNRKHDFLRIAKNKDCLIRLYLGRRNDDTPPVAADKFHLRNFPLHINEMERLDLNVSYYAELMAQALAVIHWRAGLDANDIEFVFGSSPSVSERPTAQDLAGLNKDSAAAMFKSDFHHRTVSIWVLDFNLCQTFTEDAAGLKKLVDGFFSNDPYYPRPTSAVPKDKQLWKVFSTHYVKVSGELVSHGMPTAFIEAVEERSKQHSGNTFFD